MKITIFSDNVAPYRIGWAEEMGKKNTVTFVYVKDKDAERNDSWLVKTSQTVKMVKLPAMIIKNHAMTLNTVRYLKKTSSDIIIFDGYGTIPNMLAMLYLKHKKKIYYINIDGVRIGAKPSNLKKVIKKMAFEPYARFLCGSAYSARWLQSMGIQPERIMVHNFSSIHERDILERPVSQEEKKIYRNQAGLENKRTVLAVGRFLDWKQFDLLIRAFAPLDHAYQLILIGEGDQKIVYEKLIHEKRLMNVHILDFMPYEELQNYYKLADLFVLPSNGEVWGLVINEAMCFGLPILTTDRCVAGDSLVKKGENGFIFPYNSVSKLTEQMRRILESDVIREKMAQRSLDIIKDYTIEHMAKVHLRLFETER